MSQRAPHAAAHAAPQAIWAPKKPTRVRRALNRLLRHRYRWVYRGVLTGFKRDCPEIARFRISAADKRRIVSYWRSFGFPAPSMDWWRVFGAMTGRLDEQFVPEEMFRVEIEPWLNAERLADAYADKNQIDARFADFNRPRTLLRSMHGRYFDGDYQLLDREQATQVLRDHEGPLIVKPSIDSGSGFNVHRVEVLGGQLTYEGQPLSLEAVERGFGSDFLFQQVVEQHAGLAAYHPKSLNTCRIITLRLGEAYHFVTGTFRMGRGKYIDNGHAGGLLCGISAQGQLTPFALDTHMHRYEEHPITHHPFAGQVIPHFDRMKEVAFAIHRRLVHFNMVSFDLALDVAGEPCLIEINLFGQGIEPHQVLKGEPIFGSLTPQVLELVAQRRAARGVA